MLDFDNIDDWAPRLSATLSLYMSASIKRELKKAKPKYIEDALDNLFKLTPRKAVIDTVLTWFRSMKIVGYHGSRLTSEDIDCIKKSGLILLKANDRRIRLVRALSPHPRWFEVGEKLDPILLAYAQGRRTGHREDQVHLTISKYGLTKGFNHYLKYGAEFDQHVACELLGNEGKELLSYDGKPTVIQFAVPGSEALDAAHPIFGIEDVLNKGEVPNIVKEFLESWSYQLSYPDFQSRTLKVDCGMMFFQAIPAAWIVGIDTSIEI